MRILVDMDDVLENLLEVWVSVLNAKHDLHVKQEDIVEWEMAKAYPTLTKEEIFEPFNKETFWQLTTPKKDAQKYIQMLQKDGHEIFVVTATHYNFIAMKMRSIVEKWFPSIPYNHLIITYEKQMVKGDVLVDDYLPNLIGGEYKKLLFDAPYNRQISDETLAKYGVTRVKDWAETYQAIKNIEIKEFESVMEGW